MRGIRMMLAFGVLLVAPAAASAQSSDTETANVTVTVIKGLTLTRNSHIDFGAVAVNSTKTLAPNAGTAGTFVADGQENAVITVTFSVTTQPKASDGTTTLTFTPTVHHSATSTYSATAVATGGTVTLDGTSGDRYFWVGGDLTVPSTAPTGAATAGVFSMTVAYQ